jgi:hypothetical protein
VAAGARRFAHASWLRGDRPLHGLLGMDRFPSDDTIRNLFLWFGMAEGQRFFEPMTEWMMEPVEATWVDRRAKSRFPKLLERLKKDGTDWQIGRGFHAPKGGAWLVARTPPLVRCAILCLERALESGMTA